MRSICMILLLTQLPVIEPPPAPILEPTEKTDEDLLLDAIYASSVDGVNRLLSRKPRLVNTVIHKTKNVGETALHVVASRGDIRMAELLLGYGADLTAKSTYYGTPLQTAVWHEHIRLATLFETKGARVDIFSAAGLGRTEHVKLYLDVGAILVHLRGAVETRPLHWAARAGHAETAALLLARGSPVDVRDRWQRTPLHLAAQDNRADVTALLLKHRARIEAKDCSGLTPLHHAAHWGGVEVVRLLLRHGADVNSREDIVYRGPGADFDDRPKMWTPLHRAALGGDRAIVETLIELGADLEARTRDGETPLHVSACFNSIDAAYALLEYGAEINALDHHERTPLKAALRPPPSENVAEFLRSRSGKGLDRIT